MPDKPVTHKPIAVRIKTYNTIQRIAKQLSTEKGVPVSLPMTLDLMVEKWVGDAK